MTEDAYQRSLIEYLELHGITVYATSRVMKRCQKCGQFPGGSDGVTKGLPDLMLTRPDWHGGFIGIECKGEKTPASVEQKAAAAQGHYAICRTIKEATEWIGQVCVQNGWHLRAWAKVQ